MKRFLVLPMFAAVLLSGCSSTSHPTITVTPQSGTSFQIIGTGFSSVPTCAILSYVSYAVDASGNAVKGSGSAPIPVPPGKITCSGGNFSISWTPSQANCTANTPVMVNASDIPTSSLAAAPVPVTIVCGAAACPRSFTQASAGTWGPMYFASGFEASTGALGPGPQGWSSAQATSTCFSQATFALSSDAPASTGYVNGVQQSGGFEQCTYGVGSAPAGACTTWKNNQNVSLTFTCPYSGGCQ